MNNWIGHGRLTKDPELRYTNNGKPVCNMTLAVEDGYGDYKNTEFIKIVVWGKKGKAAAKHLKKGRQAIVEGKLTIRKNEKGDRTYINPEIVASNVKFIYSSKKNNDDSNETEEHNSEEQPPAKDTEDIPDEDDFEVPF